MGLWKFAVTMIFLQGQRQETTLDSEIQIDRDGWEEESESEESLIGLLLLLSLMLICDVDMAIKQKESELIKQARLITIRHFAFVRVGTPGRSELL